MSNSNHESIQDLDILSDNNLRVKKINTYFILKQKMCGSDNLIHQYNDKIIEYEEMKSELQKTIFNYSMILGKVVELEMKNSDYRKQIQNLSETVSKQEIKLTSDKSYIDQLIFKTKELEESHSNISEEYNIDKIMHQDKIKELEQELKKLQNLKPKRPNKKTCNKAINTNLIEKKLTCDIGINTDLIKNNKIFDEESNTTSSEKMESNFSKSINVGTQVSRVAPLSVSNKCTSTDEFHIAKDNLYPLFCSKCLASLDSPPLDQICRIMTTVPKPVEMITSPKRKVRHINFINNETDNSLPQQMSNVLHNLNIGSSHSDSGRESFNSHELLMEKLQKKVIRLEKKFKEQSKKQNKTSTTCCQQSLMQYASPFTNNILNPSLQTNLIVQLLSKILEQTEKHQEPKRMKKVKIMEKKLQKLISRKVKHKRNEALSTTSNNWDIEVLPSKVSQNETQISHSNSLILSKKNENEFYENRISILNNDSSFDSFDSLHYKNILFNNKIMRENDILDSKIASPNKQTSIILENNLTEEQGLIEANGNNHISTVSELLDKTEIVTTENSSHSILNSTKAKESSYSQHNKDDYNSDSYNSNQTIKEKLRSDILDPIYTTKKNSSKPQSKKNTRSSLLSKLKRLKKNTRIKSLCRMESNNSANSDNSANRNILNLPETITKDFKQKRKRIAHVIKHINKDNLDTDDDLNSDTPLSKRRKLIFPTKHIHNNEEEREDSDDKINKCDSSKNFDLSPLGREKNLDTTKEGKSDSVDQVPDKLKKTMELCGNLNNSPKSESIKSIGICENSDKKSDEASKNSEHVENCLDGNLEDMDRASDSITDKHFQINTIDNNYANEIQNDKMIATIPNNALTIRDDDMHTNETIIVTDDHLTKNNTEDNIDVNTPMTPKILLKRFIENKKKAFLKSSKNCISAALIQIAEKFVLNQLERIVNEDEWPETVHADVVQNLMIKSNSRIISKVLIEFLVKNIKQEALDKTYTPPAPLMTKTQQRIVAVIFDLKLTFPDICNNIQSGIEYRLFKLGESPRRDELEYLSRLYAILAKLQKDREKLRIFCSDCLYVFKAKASSCIFTVLQTWPEVIPKYEFSDIMSKCLVHLILTTKVVGSYPKIIPLKNMLMNVYEYPKSGYDSIRFAKELLNDLKTKPHDMLENAIILLAKKEGTEWTFENIVQGGLLQMIVNKQHPCIYRALFLLGFLLRPFPIEDSKKQVAEIIDQLCDLINYDEDTTLDCNDQQEGVIAALLLLSRHNYEKVYSTVIKWVPKKNIRDLTRHQFNNLFKMHEIKMKYK